MEKFDLKVEGVMPLLMHNNNLEARDMITARGQKGGKAGDDRYPADKWKSALYVDDKCVCVPAENLLAALLHAGKGISIGRMKSLKAASQGLFFSEFYVPLEVNGKIITREQIEAIDGTFAEQAAQVHKLGFSLFVKPVGVNGKSHVRVRPRFDHWGFKTRFETDNEDLLSGADRIESLFADAGRKAGIGDWRPSSPKKPGMYGTFTTVVKKVK